MAFTIYLISFSQLPDEGALGLHFQTSAYHIFKQNILSHGFFSNLILERKMNLCLSVKQRFSISHLAHPVDLSLADITAQDFQHNQFKAISALYHEGQVSFANSRVNMSEIGLTSSNFGNTEFCLYLLPGLDTNQQNLPVFYLLLFHWQLLAATVIKVPSVNPLL